MSTPHLRPPKRIVSTEQRALQFWEDGLDTKAIAECLGIHEADADRLLRRAKDIRRSRANTKP